MKILIVNAHDIQGGAARAAYRLHVALRSIGVDSTMLVQYKGGDDYTVIGPVSKMQKGLARLGRTLDRMLVCYYKNRTKTLFSPAWLPFSGVSDRINSLKPDVVHLHWICGGMMSVDDISRIEAPVVWSLHDMWAFTGGCHYDENCLGYRQDCSCCKVLGAGKRNFLSRTVFLKKLKVYNKLNDLTVIGTSTWITNCIKSSVLMKNKKIVTLYNPLDTELFRPMDKKQARAAFRLPDNKKIILFGAMNLYADLRKGFAEFSKALEQVRLEEAVLLIAGSHRPQEPVKFKFPTFYLSRLNDDISLAMLYNVADVLVVPSLQETFGQIASEAMSCGVPVVCFDKTGLTDIVEHKKNGYIARAFEPSDLAAGIEWILTTKKYKELCLNAREKAVREFSEQVVAEKYINVYKDILKKKEDKRVC